MNDQDKNALIALIIVVAIFLIMGLATVGTIMNKKISQLDQRITVLEEL